MPLMLENLGATPWVLALLYLASSGYVVLKLKYLHNRSPELDTTKMFVISVLLSCSMRCLSFIAIGSLSLNSIKFDSEGGTNSKSIPESKAGQDPDTQFYEKAVLVLFDLPDFMIISAYVLLALVWAEAFIQSRSHWLSVKQFRRMWLLSYLIFNACLYAGQLVLYTLLFLPNGNQEFLSKVIFLTLTIINFSLPVILLLLFFYLSIMFAGFPNKSTGARSKLRKVNKVMVSWTIGRIVWGIVVLTTILQGWLTNAHHDHQVYSIVLVGLFLITELIPFFHGLDHDLLSLIALDSRSANQGPSVYTSANYGSLPNNNNNGHTPSSESSLGLEAGEHHPRRREEEDRRSAFTRKSYGSEEGLILDSSEGGVQE